MNTEDFKKIVQEIIAQADVLKRMYVSESALVNYACVFCQNDAEYAQFIELASKIGKVVQKTTTGPLFQITPLPTVAGNLQLLKIRTPDPTRPERGDVDFTLTDYDVFKKEHLGQKGFSLINKENFEMIELLDPKFSVRVYFSNPPLVKQIGVI